MKDEVRNVIVEERRVIRRSKRREIILGGEVRG